LRAENRVWAAFGAIFGLLLVLVWGLFLGPVLAGGRLTIGTIFGALVVLAGIVTSCYFILAMLRQVFLRDAFVEVTGATMLIHHPVLFRRDVHVPLKQIRAVSVDQPSDSGWWSASDVSLMKEQRGLQRIAGRNETEEVLEYLTHFMVPLMSHDPADKANVAILLHEPLDLLGHRRWGWLHKEMGSRWNSRERGVLFRVVNPAEAASVFADAGLLRKFEGDDFSLIEPSRRDYRRAFWKRLFGYLFVGLVAVRVAEALLSSLR
jgi:hypothetical protein